MKIYLYFPLLLILLNVLPACKDEVDNPYIDPPECPGRFPDLGDWEYDPLNLESNQYVNALYFGGSGKGVASTFDEIWKTDNDGVKWKKVYDGPVSNLYHIRFSDPDHGFVTGEISSRAYLLTTQNGGMSWDSFYFPAYRTIENISFADSLRGLAVFSDHNYKEYLFKTNDGGRSWEKNAEISPIVYPYANLEIKPSGFGYVLSKGSIFFTEDYGDTWIKTETGISYSRVVQFLDRQTGFIAASKAILKTQDGGLTWDTISHADVDMLHFYSIDEGVSTQITDHWLNYDVVSSCLAFATTYDGGKNWKIGESTSQGILRDANYVGTDLIYGTSYRQEFNLIKIYR